MALEAATYKDGKFTITSLSPDVCLTPMGPGTPPVPYPISHAMDTSEQCSKNVFIDGKPVFLHGESFVDGCHGDEPGVKGGVVTGVQGKVSHSIMKSPSVYVNGKQMVRTGDQVWMNQKPPA
jgi:uncharacterized Zn-binding protein involved in type VI secretion